MKNKYQEALNFLDWHCEVAHTKHQDLLQELVDKETPMKPMNRYKADFGRRGCFKCEGLVSYKMAYCPDCGQKIDWSDND